MLLLLVLLVVVFAAAAAAVVRANLNDSAWAKTVLQYLRSPKDQLRSQRCRAQKAKRYSRSEGRSVGVRTAVLTLTTSKCALGTCYWQGEAEKSGRRSGESACRWLLSHLGFFWRVRESESFPICVSSPTSTCKEQGKKRVSSTERTAGRGAGEGDALVQIHLPHAHLQLIYLKLNIEPVQVRRRRFVRWRLGPLQPQRGESNDKGIRSITHAWAIGRTCHSRSRMTGRKNTLMYASMRRAAAGSRMTNGDMDWSCDSLIFSIMSTESLRKLRRGSKSASV